MYYFDTDKDKIYDRLKTILDFKYPNTYFATQLHGTFSSKNVKYISDVDMELHILYQNDKKQMIDFIKTLIDKLIKDGYIFENFLSGLDSRLNMSFKIMKNGSIRNYNQKNVKDIISNAVKSGILTKDEEKEINKYIVSNPNWEQAQKILNLIEDKHKITWTIDEIKKGKKKYYGVEYDLIDTVITENFPDVLTLIMPYDGNKYINVDVSFMIVGFENVEDGKKYFSNNKKNCIDHQEGKIILNDRIREITTLHFYHGFFKNIVDMKYFKALKRLRTVLGTCIHKHFDSFNNSNKDCYNSKYRHFIWKEREEIRKLSNTELGAYNQFKNRLGILNYMMEHKLLKEMEIKEQIIILMKDLIKEVNFRNDIMKDIEKELKKKTFDINKQQELWKKMNKDINNEMNRKAYPLLVKHYNNVKFLIPLKWNYKK